MTIFTDGLLTEPEQQGIQELPLSAGRYVGETFTRGLEENPVPSLARAAQVLTVKPQPEEDITDPMTGIVIGRSAAYTPPTIPMEEARKRVKEAGLESQLPNLGSAPEVGEQQLDIMMQHARERQHREANLARGPSGILPGVAATGAGFLAGAIDPLNAAAFAIPVVGEARTARLLAGAGESIMGRAAVRASIGAAGGAVGTLPLIPLDAMAYTIDGRDYGFADALKSIAANAGLGGVLHAAGGAGYDVWRGFQGRPVYPFAPGEPFERRPGAVPPPPGPVPPGGAPPVPPPAAGGAPVPPLPPVRPAPAGRIRPGAFPAADELIAHPEVSGRAERGPYGFNIEDVLATPRVAEAIETPTINREHDVPYGSLANEAGGVFIDRNVPAQAEIDGVKFSPALPLNVGRQVEREALERVLAAFKAKKGREPTDMEMGRKGGILDYVNKNYVEPAEKAWVTSRGIDWDKYQEAKRQWHAGIDHENPVHPPEGAYLATLPPRLRERLRGGAQPPVPPPAETSGLREMGGRMAKGIAESLHEHLWSRIQAGEVTEQRGMPPSTLLQAAKVIRERGGLKTFEEYKAFADDYGRNVHEGTPTFQQDMRALVARHVPKPVEKSAVPGFVEANRAEAVRVAQQLGLTDRIAELARQGKTAREISDALGGTLSVDDVRAVRESLGIEAAGPLAAPGGAEIPQDVSDAALSATFRDEIAKMRAEEGQETPPAAEPSAAATAPPRAEAPAAPEPTKADVDRTVREVAKEAGHHAVSALDEAATGLWELFGRGKRTFGGLPGFDEETYARAKPHFIKAAYHFREAGGNVHELMRRLVRALRDTYGFKLDDIERMEPYAIRFVQDVHSGALDLKKAVTEETIGKLRQSYDRIRSDAKAEPHEAINTSELLDAAEGEHGLTEAQAEEGLSEGIKSGDIIRYKSGKNDFIYFVPKEGLPQYGEASPRGAVSPETAPRLAGIRRAYEEENARTGAKEIDLNDLNEITGFDYEDARDVKALNEGVASGEVIRRVYPELDQNGRLKSTVEFGPSARERERSDIIARVSDQLENAGRPREEAEAVAAAIADHYIALADAFKGAAGTATEIMGRPPIEVRRVEYTGNEASTGGVRTLFQPMGYHGTTQDITDVDLEKGGSRGGAPADKGVAYFFPREENAKRYGSNIIARDISFENAKTYDATALVDDPAFVKDMRDAFWQRAEQKGLAEANIERQWQSLLDRMSPTHEMSSRNSHGQVRYNFAITSAILKRAREEGADVAIIKNMAEGHGPATDQILVLNRRAFKGEGDRELFQRPTAPPFYSAVERAITSSKQSKASPDQWLGMLKNMPGVKPEEMEWLGLDDWLKEQKGSVTKEQIQDYIRANRIEVREVSHGSAGPEYSQALQKVQQAFDEFHAAPHGSPEADAAFERFNAATEAAEALKPGRSKYESYQLPGGENYREILLTLPQPKTQFEIVPEGRYFKLRRPDGSFVPDRWLTREDAEEAAQAPAVQAEYTPSVYKSSHWQEPNILAHVRFNERTIDGKRTLFVEEVQSDWHQAGKKRGYQTKVDTSGWSVVREQRPNQIGGYDNVAIIRDAEGNVLNEIYSPLYNDAVLIAEEAAERQRERVPDAPFKTTWPELAMKRMLRYASENGYDQVAWTTGATQAERYDLSKQVSEIKWHRLTHDLEAKDKNGRRVLEKQQVHPEELPDIIGKEAADKIVNAPSHKSPNGEIHFLTGLDLKVGGEGMKGFYDQILPATVNKLVKKFGAKVGKGEVGAKVTPEEIRAIGEQKSARVQERMERIAADVEAGRPLAEALAEHGNREVEAALGAAGKKDAPPAPVHVLPLTDKLKEAALNEGFPMFQPPPEAGEGEPLGRVTFTDAKTIIDLFKNANVSTPIHEWMGHVWLEELHHFAARSDAPDWLKQDLKTVRDWLGAKDNDPLTNDQHEQFARGFEQYMREGRAPSRRLAAVFEKIKEWMLAIYRRVTELGIPINDDIRGVFDRMLATQEDIADYAKDRPPVPQEPIEPPSARGEEGPTVNPATGTNDILPPVQSQEVLKGAIGSLIEGRPVRAGEQIEATKPQEEAAPPVATGRVVAPEGFQVDAAQLITEREGKRRGVPYSLYIGEYHANAQRLSPWSINTGFGKTPEEAQLNALRLVGAPERAVPTPTAEPAAPPPQRPAVASGPRAKDPADRTLFEHLAANGGIRPDADLQAVLGKVGPFVPGWGPLLRPNGKPIDLIVRDGDVEAYLGKGATVRDLMDAIHDESRGRKRYQMGNEPAPAFDAEGSRAAHEAHVMGMLQEAGISPDDLTAARIDRVIEIMQREHVDNPEVAFEQAVMEEAKRAEDAGEIPPVPPELHVPGWDDDGGPAPEAGGILQPFEPAEGAGSSPVAPSRGEGAQPPPYQPVVHAVSLANHFRDYFLSLPEFLEKHAAHLEEGNRFATIVQARRFAKEMGFGDDPKAIDEAIEQGAVQAARAIALGEGSEADKYAELVKVYDRQPRLGVRTSTSMRDQAYSTPVPLAYLASRLARVEPMRRVYEPSAGNGALLMEVEPPEFAVANEINPARAEVLKDQGFKVTEKDASDPQQGKDLRAAGGVDVVIANPPFGAIKEGLTSKVFDMSDIQSGYKTHEIDHAIVLRSLEAMKDDGNAVLLIGGVNKLAKSQEAKSDAYSGKAKREFFKVLFDRYNVTDMFTVVGELYSRQGAGWPIDVIVIQGRGKSARALPAVEPPRVYTSWDQLGEVLNGRRGDEGVSGGQPGATPVELPAGTEAAGDVGGGEAPGGGGPAGGIAPEGEPGPVRVGPVPGEPGNEAAGGAGVEPPPGGGLEPGGERGGAGGPGGEPAAERRPSGVAESGEAASEAAEATKEALEPPAEPPKEEPKVRPRIVKSETETGAQVAYTPQSKHNNLGTLVPVNMKKSVADALAGVAERRGDIDKFVAGELGYSDNAFGNSFAAEQIDALALAIDNIKQGKGFVIGDQTGIGKGRVNAAIIRWAIRNNRIPIFVTEKPNLYGDMYRDLTDIELADMLGREPRFLMTNAGEDVPLDEEGKVRLKTPAAKAHNAMLANLPGSAKEFLKDYDAVFTNYSQMQTVAGEDTARRAFLARIAPEAVVIFDESHNAGGQKSDFTKPGPPDRAAFARQLVAAAKGVFYSSATYAKRPDVMDLYSKTDMAMAVDDPKNLGNAIAKGGVPMQQAVAAMLARAGQYVRRERSFAGINYDTPTVPVDRKMYDGVSRVLNAVNEFSKLVADAAEQISQTIKAEAAAVSGDGSTGGAGADSINFTAIMHNVINQALLAMKAKPAAKMAIEALERGEKPVLTVSGTMEAFLTEYAENLGINVGDPIPADFGDVLKKYLDRTRTLIIKKPFMKKGEKGERKYLSDAELGPLGVSAYKAAKKLIDGLDLKDLPISPIDAIRNELTQAGYRVGEITGRGTIVDYSGARPILRSRPGAEVTIKGRRETISRFNGGAKDKPLPKDQVYDAMILNQAGSTGLSLHASERFAEQQPRVMFIVQPEANIDTHMQLLGRIHRTGQVVLPRYAQLIADIPAEKRPAAVLAKKMASLNANTTAARGSAMTAKDVPDFMNLYGDMVAAQLMADSPETNARLGHPVAIDDNGRLKVEDAMRKTTGRIPLLPLAEQERLYSYLESEYNSLLEQMKAAGENALEAQTLDLRAQTIERREVVSRKAASDSPFAAPVQLEKAMVRRLGKPFRSDEVVSKILDAIGAAPPEGVTAANAGRLLEDLSDKSTPLGQRAAAKHEKQAKDAIADFDSYKRGILDEIENPDRQEAEREKQDATKDRWTSLHDQLAPGERIILKTSNGNLTGIVTKIEQKGKPKNPLALSTWKVDVAIADATRRIELPFSRLYDEGRAPQDDAMAIELGHITDWVETKQHTLDRYDSLQSDSLEPRYIATGNLLAAYDWLKNKGRIVNYTDSEGHVKQGILTPKDFDLAKHQQTNATSIGDAAAVMQHLRENPGTWLATKDDVVKISFNPRVGGTIAVAGAKRLGGVYYLDKGLTDAMGRDFVKRGNIMSADVREQNLQPAIARIQQLGGQFVSVKDLPPAEQVSAPPPRAPAMTPQEAWQTLASEPLPHEERASIEASRAADRMAEPESASVDSGARAKAALSAAEETNQQFENAQEYMSDEDRAAYEAAQQEYSREQQQKAEVIRQGMACLMGGGFGNDNTKA